MGTSSDVYTVGLFDDKYLAFLETVVEIRPRLHRYCARMTGSVMDGEDVVQEVLFEAYRKLDQYDNARALAPWLFGIAHNRCIDLLRRRCVREEAEAAAAIPELFSPALPSALGIGRAVERLVIHLPPKERACVLLKDVLDYTILEIADLVGSTEGGVKAALSRGRGKLAALPPAKERESAADPELSQLLHLYVERFNQRDWNGLRELTSADAQLLFADGYGGRLQDSPYFSKYESSPINWHMAVGEVDGETVILRMEQDAEEWKLNSVIRFELENGHIVRIADYHFCPWVLPAAGLVTYGITGPARLAHDVSSAPLQS
jgi:RNA polymerase sigma-70 factor, ECF subfamily